MSNVFAVGIELHLAGHALVAGSSGERVADAAFIQAGAANSVEQNAHLVISERGKVIGLFVIAGLITAYKLLPEWIAAIRVVGINRSEAFRRRTSEFDKFVA